MQVNKLIGIDELGNDTHHRANDVDVLSHDLLRAGALHLNGNVLARHQTSAVHLRERCATKRIGIDRIEHLPQAQAVFFLQTAKHYLVRHRLHVGAQTTQLVAKALRQNLGPVGQNLPHLDEHGAEFLEQAAQTNRREVIPHAVLFDQANNLPNAFATTRRRELVFLVRRHRVGLLGDHIDSARLFASARDGGIDLIDNRRLVTQRI